MKRGLAICLCLSVSSVAFAGFRVKLVKPKRPEKFQVQLTVGSVTYAADLLFDGKVQNEFFYKELTPAHVIAVRLAVFNQGQTGLVLPLGQLQLIDPSGKQVAPIAPEIVAQALLQGLMVTAQAQDKSPVQVSPTMGDPRYDPTDPRYDPRADPRNDPRYDPRNDPTSPRYDPNDPSNTRRYPNGTYGGPWGRPGVDIILNPGGGGVAGDLSQFEKALVEKDFIDKAHSLDPVDASTVRDKFLYFSLPDIPGRATGFKLLLPSATGRAQEIVLQF